ncbi:hypothetical protein [Spongiactinospora sp. TRM90649]|uniref:hypothetical protein n=1 Tax=Spongiactinospora sp. TRM90649 TaxID=3031114 RepID=UPI0023F7F435|nr:hypothetical protein [Spongiactinospora sp. TRM90649]MDF5759099.1 hypothetical protein [Spongiactinospora sp. TRM90649]
MLLRRGWVRLDADPGRPLSRGFSGGGLRSADYRAVVALIGHAHTSGNRGRAISE